MQESGSKKVLTRRHNHANKSAFETRGRRQKGIKVESILCLSSKQFFPENISSLHKAQSIVYMHLFIKSASYTLG